MTKATAERYVGAGKKEKGRILDEFALLTKYNRSYTGYVLRNISEWKVSSVVREGINKRKVYDEAVMMVLRVLALQDNPGIDR